MPIPLTPPRAIIRSEASRIYSALFTGKLNNTVKQGHYPMPVLFPGKTNQN